MMFPCVLLVACIYFLNFSSAQSASTTSSSAAPTHTVAVGEGGLVFTPNQIAANVGDIVEFRFYPQNHSVARADFKSPCIPYEDTGINRVGFWSGFHPVAVVLSDPPKFQVLINDTEPVFFYCSAPGACITDGMVGVINQNSTETFDTQFAYAKNSTLAFSPGEYFPSEEAPTTSSSSMSSTSTPKPTSTPTQTPTTTPVAAASKPLSNGAIAGVAVGGSAVLVLLAALIYLCGRQRTMGEIIRQSQHPPPSFTPGHLSIMSDGSYPPKMAQAVVEPRGNGRYSAQEGGYQRSNQDTESFRSRSPPPEDGRELVIPPLNLNRSSPQGSPRSMSPTPVTPGRPLSETPQQGQMTSMNETMQREYQPYRPADATAPAALKVQRFNSQRGPHELPAVGEDGSLQSPSQDNRINGPQGHWGSVR